MNLEKKSILFTREVNMAKSKINKFLKKSTQTTDWKMKEGQHNDSAGKGACCLGRPHELEPQDVHGEKKDAGLTYAHMSWRMLPCASLYTSPFFLKKK